MSKVIFRSLFLLAALGVALFGVACELAPPEEVVEDASPEPMPVEPSPPQLVHRVILQTDEADAAVAILEKLVRAKAVEEEDWHRLIATEGYLRLQQRELGMGREFDDSSFRDFLQAPETVAATLRLAETVADWSSADLDTAAKLALAYLPSQTPLEATLYPVIKPLSNSFVFEIESDPAIFMFVDPEISRAQLENTLAHELHHIGYAAACPDPDSSLLDPVRAAIVWAGAFGEGLAMLAAAGGVEIHPHLHSKPEDRARWDEDVSNFETDLRRVETFFQDVLSEKFSDTAEVVEVARSFFGVQGPWYTVGWKMAAVIEETFGRERLIAVMCDPRDLLNTYNQAASQMKADGENLPLWSQELLTSWADSPGVAGD